MNLRDFGQRLIPTGERSGLLTLIAKDGKCFVVRADEKLTAFVELESAISASTRKRLNLNSRSSSRVLALKLAG